MWLSVYQSATIWLFSGPFTVPAHSFTVPQGQIGGRPSIHSAKATATMMGAIAATLRGPMPRIICNQR